MKPLVKTDWLLKNLNKVRIFDATWHLPGSGKNAQDEFNETHIPGAKFFDIDKNSDLNSKLPHIMPKAHQWKNIISNYGVKNDDHIVIYDNSELYSSCRVWFSFIYFGHNPNLISVLNGGFKKWLKENKVVTSKTENFNKSDYLVEEKENLIIKKKDVDSNMNTKKFFMLDARSRERFLGKVKDVRPFLRDSSVFVLPSYYREGVPKSILEAMAMGRPIITCDSIGCRETVRNKKNGFLINPKDVRSLYLKMKLLIDKPELIKTMSLESIKFSKTFDVKDVNLKIIRSMKII